MQMRSSTPGWGLAAALVCALALPASAQPRGKADKNGAKADKNDKGTTAPADKADAPDPAPTGKAAKATKKDPKTYDFNALDLNGRMRTPQLLYFLERANEELERASLEKRSFIPHMVRSVDEEAL
jgi:hypothetical protein